MARGKQLQELISQLRSATGRNQGVAVGTSELDNLKIELAATQELLYDDYDWPFLNVEREVQIQEGQRYYDLPEDLNYDRIDCVKLRRNGIYTDVTRGIAFDDFSIYDSNLGERSAPVLKWDIRHTGVKEQLETWPISSEPASLHFFGTLALPRLTQDEDRALLDDRLIVLFTAADMLARQKSPDAKNKLDKANARLLKLRGNSQSASKMVQVGLGNRRQSTYSGKTVLVVR